MISRQKKNVKQTPKNLKKWLLSARHTFQKKLPTQSPHENVAHTPLAHNLLKLAQKTANLVRSAPKKPKTSQNHNQNNCVDPFIALIDPDP